MNRSVTESNVAKRAFVTGFPVDHSRSPLVHGHWLTQHGIRGSYERHAVETPDFPAFMAGLPKGPFIGGNVTLPHKEAAFELADRTTERADAVGAVNTLWAEDGLVWGDNTDGYGFTANLDERAAGWDAANRLSRGALVLGAGGASRAIVHALLSRGFQQVTIANRTLSRARALAGTFGPKCRPVALANLDPGGVSFVVNTTALGMDGKDTALPLDVARLDDDCVVADIVYTPLATPFLVEAAMRGLSTVDGLGMLLHQAVPGFERWFGVRPAVTPALRQLVIDDMERSR